MIESMSQSFQFHIAAEDAGRRLDEFLASRFGGLSRLRLQNLVKAGACRINQAVMPAGWRLAVGDVVDVTLDDAPPTAMEPEAIPLDILHEDEQIIVVAKPAGLLVHPNKGAKRGTLANALAYHLNRDYYADAADLVAPAHGAAHQLTRPGLVHRLDRATSGVMVVAKTQRALSLLSRHFHRRLVEKRYLALVNGAVAADAGRWQAPIDRDPARQPHWWVSEGGRPSVTDFTVRERLREATLLELTPVTGRTNQLRIHAAYFGHAIIGDEIYGDAGREDAVTRLCLHAWRLAFHHPATGEWLEFAAPLPDAFARLVAARRG
ncbi:MAG TPA: RluA family pseudouridine synthase [Blastocatellia bacterium]|nr:RluA family pseudouridine synthase [Blastocatellia bacterium]